MKIIIIQLLIILSFSAVSGQGIIEIDIPGLLKTERSPVLSEIASDIQFVKLQTTPECLIQSVASVARWGNNFLVVSNSKKSLFVFSQGGKYLRSVGTLGKGPGEYLEIYGMAFDVKTDHLFILDNGQVKLMEFDENGKYIKEFKLGFYATGVKVVDTGFYFYTGSIYTYRTDGCLLTVTDRNGKVLNRYHKTPFKKGITDRNAVKYTDGSNWCYWESYWDTVYTFNGSSYHPKYYFNIGKDRIPQEYLESSDMFQYDIDGYRWIAFYIEFQNFLYFQFIDKGRIGKQLFYDKNRRTGYWIPGNRNYNDWGFENDFCGGPLFTIMNRLSMNELGCAYQITDLKEYVSKGWIDSKKAKNQVRYKELTDMINQSSAEDNPILAIAKLK
jgi:hypothetical protein